jgi:hypothetical protein
VALPGCYVHVCQQFTEEEEDLQRCCHTQEGIGHAMQAGKQASVRFIADMLFPCIEDRSDALMGSGENLGASPDIRGQTNERKGEAAERKP